ncbi:hypothetical protein AB4Y87_24945 [Paenarthrobacter sp. RAF54_2]|uniref:hypothetical protein n=1 Tax=Paenarthrobacter sp. RAF54_2 TaxID=3233061 RepID=UPI003F953670
MTFRGYGYEFLPKPRPVGGQVVVYAMQYEAEWAHHARLVSTKPARNTGSPAAKGNVAAGAAGTARR